MTTPTDSLVPRLFKDPGSTVDARPSSTTRISTSRVYRWRLPARVATGRVRGPGRRCRPSFRSRAVLVPADAAHDPVRVGPCRRTGLRAPGSDRTHRHRWVAGSAGAVGHRCGPCGTRLPRPGSQARHQPGRRDPPRPGPGRFAVGLAGPQRRNRGEELRAGRRPPAVPMALSTNTRSRATSTPCSSSWSSRSTRSCRWPTAGGGPSRSNSAPA